MNDNGTQNIKALSKVQTGDVPHLDDHADPNRKRRDGRGATQGHRANVRPGGVSVRPVYGECPGAPTLGILERWHQWRAALETGAFL